MRSIMPLSRSFWSRMSFSNIIGITMRKVKMSVFLETKLSSLNFSQKTNLSLKLELSKFTFQVLPSRQDRKNNFVYLSFRRCYCLAIWFWDLLPFSNFASSCENKNNQLFWPTYKFQSIAHFECCFRSNSNSVWFSNLKD